MNNKNITLEIVYKPTRNRYWVMKRVWENGVMIEEYHVFTSHTKEEARELINERLNSEN